MYKALEPNNLVEDGTYQATIASVEVRDNFNKTDKQLTIEWKLSNGRVLFDRIGKDKDGSGEFNHYKIGLILYATGVKEVESNEDLISKLLGKTCEVTVTHLYSEAKKGDYNSITYYDLELPKEGVIELTPPDDNDLPF